MNDDVNYKQKLLEEIKSADHNLRFGAIFRLYEKGWLQDGNLVKTSFVGANFYGLLNAFVNSVLPFADFSHCILTEVDFRFANLKGARFIKAEMIRVMFEDTHLEETVFTQANLTSALIEGYLRDASFQQANMEYAIISGELNNVSFKYSDLRHATFIQADLRGTDLSQANLENANMLEGLTFDEQTFLPDGSTWTLETDFTRFTDATHPNFWRSDDSMSPAYKPDAVNN